MDKLSAFKRETMRDVLQLLLFGICVVVGVITINAFVFRSFSVDGASMEQTLQPGDRLIVNRLPVTWSTIQGKEFVPMRGEIIVFKNPRYSLGQSEEYVVKRVIAFEGERVVLKDGHYTVYNSDNPKGFDPDDSNSGEPQTPTAGSVDVTVPAGRLFVSGDHRQLNQNGVPYSLDSRNGLGYIPLANVVGPVNVRIFPFQSIRTFK
jgi:signal peptidase I